MAIRKGEEIKFAGRSLSSFEGMVDEEILGVKGIGPKTLEEIRAAQAEAVAEAAEPEVAEVVESEPETAEPKAESQESRKCETCGNSFVPAKLEFKHCPRCHAKWQFEQDFPKVEGKLEGAKKAFGRFNSYKPAQVLFDEARDYFVEGNFEAALAALKEASDKVDAITAQGSLKYARRLFAEAEENSVSVDEGAIKLADQVEAALPKEGKSGKPWQAAKNAGKLRDLLRPLASEIREAKDRGERAKFVGAPVREIIPSDSCETLGEMREEARRRENKERDRRERDRSKRPPPKDKRGRGLQAEIEAGLEQTGEERG